MLTQDEINKMDAITGFKTPSPQQAAVNKTSNSRIDQLHSLASQKQIAQDTQQNQQQTGGSTNNGIFHSIVEGGKSVFGALTQNAANVGQDIGYGLSGGQKNIDKITQQYKDSADVLTQLAAKQTDPARKEKYARMAADDLAEGQKAGLDLKGRTPEQMVGDVLGLGLDVATTLTGLKEAQGAAEAFKGLSTGQKVLKGAITGAKTGAVLGAGYGATGGLQEGQDLQGVAEKTLQGATYGAGGGAVLGAGGGLVSGMLSKGEGAATKLAGEEGAKIEGAVTKYTPEQEQIIKGISPSNAETPTKLIEKGIKPGGGISPETNFAAGKVSPPENVINASIKYPELLKEGNYTEKYQKVLTESSNTMKVTNEALKGKTFDPGKLETNLNLATSNITPPADVSKKVWDKKITTLVKNIVDHTKSGDSAELRDYLLKYKSRNSGVLDRLYGGKTGTSGELADKIISAMDNTLAEGNPEYSKNVQKMKDLKQVSDWLKPFAKQSVRSADIVNKANRTPVGRAVLKLGKKAIETLPGGAIGGEFVK